MAKAYFDLLRELWNGDSRYLSPYDFRQIFVRFHRQFASFSQHDSHEMLTFVMDGLHEDLNRVKSKPYIELKEKEPGETEIQASSRWWNNHLKRENSIIVDLFHGQYKSTITCPECKLISITYDPFMHLGIPIPSSQSSIIIKVFPNSEENQDEMFKFRYEDIGIIETTRVNDIYNYFLPKNTIAFSVDKSLNFKEFCQDKDIVTAFYENKQEIIISELPDDNKLSYYFITTPVEITEQKTFYFTTQKTVKNLFYPKILNIKKDLTVRDFYFLIFKQYRLMFKDIAPERTKKKYLEMKDDPNYQFQEFTLYMNENFKKNYYFRIHILNNIPENSGFFSNKENCEFCNKKCDYCLFNFNMNDHVENIFKKIKFTRTLHFTVEVINPCLNFLQKINSEEKNLVKRNEIKIEDCFEMFRSVEKLEKDNAWYCSKCKKLQEANKKLEIYRSPKILIVQLKRFKIKSTNSYLSIIQNKKNESMVYFGKELNLDRFICSEDKKGNNYELFAISQHFGGLSSGHYTSVCKNKGKWYKFDDENVTKASDEDVFNKSAYLLFYAKKN